jgi:hypothetical protein
MKELFVIAAGTAVPMIILWTTEELLKRSKLVKGRRDCLYNLVLLPTLLGTMLVVGGQIVKRPSLLTDAWIIGALAVGAILGMLPHFIATRIRRRKSAVR